MTSVKTVLLVSMGAELISPISVACYNISFCISKWEFFLKKQGKMSTPINFGEEMKIQCTLCIVNKTFNFI